MEFLRDESKPALGSAEGRSQRRPRADDWYRFCVIALLAMLIAACQSPPPPPSAIGAATELVWPQPPAQARIHYRLEIRTPLDLGIRPGLLRRLWNWLMTR